MSNMTMSFSMQVSKYAAKCGTFLSEVTRKFGVPTLVTDSELFDIYEVRTHDEEIEYLCEVYEDVVEDYWWN